MLVEALMASSFAFLSCLYQELLYCYVEPGASPAHLYGKIRTFEKEAQAMALEPGMIVHTVNRWLDTRLRYEGHGRAEFANPKGAVEGPATVSFRPSGEGTVVIKTERIDSPDPASFSLQASPSQPQEYA